MKDRFIPAAHGILIGAKIRQAMIEEVRSEYPAECELFNVRPNSFYAASTISRAFNLNGPAMSFDAACASGLYAFSAATNALQLGEIDNAISYYEKAANYNDNELVTPTFLLKAGWAYEVKQENEKALKAFEKIKEEYPRSREARDIDKYIARVKSKLGEL